MEQVTLNLARKWRSKNFKEIIGQDLVVRVLQNSLFKQAFFPVYLFSGQRGCGKTSTARVFAAALNCHKISEFQKNPKEQQVPCLSCDSCTAMMNMRHPDFVEIDAASYTGVDNIRNIIDTSSFLPVLSKRKIYLIDEVHMLSKAAFNAFLKILEEPPSFVTFILATTEMQKLPETVKSRCFQLLFNPVTTDTVVGHLETMCTKESIPYEISGLELIAQTSEGSLRDAINLLEQTRFASDKVTAQVVSKVLGYLDDQVIFTIFASLIQKDHQSLLEQLAKIEQKTVSSEYIVTRLQELAYDAVRIKYKVEVKHYPHLPESLRELINQADTGLFVLLFEKLCNLDQLFLKTTKKYVLLESCLLKLSMKEHLQQSVEKKKLNNQGNANFEEKWSQFTQAIVKVVDPVLYSMLCVSDFKEFNEQKKVVHISASKKFVMFQDLFVEQKSAYQPMLERCFGAQVVLFVDFNKQDTKHIATATKRNTVAVSEKREIVKEKTEKIVLSDEKKWNITHALLSHFGGTVSEIIKETHEQDT